VAGTNSALFGEGWAAVAGGIACVLAVVALMAWRPGFLRYDARHPVP
jgi:ENTS family enterobactin (siderophore) exporter